MKLYSFERDAGCKSRRYTALKTLFKAQPRASVTDGLQTVLNVPHFQFAQGATLFGTYVAITL